MLEDYAPEIPWRMGRGLDHFRSEGAKLVPPPTGDDPYIEEAYRLWQIKQRSK